MWADGEGDQRDRRRGKETGDAKEKRKEGERKVEGEQTHLAGVEHNHRAQGLLELAREARRQAGEAALLDLEGQRQLILRLEGRRQRTLRRGGSERTGE